MAEGNNEEKTLRLEKKIFIEGEILALTGIHVGGASTGLTIGGADKVVVRNPVTNLPYIPGSSLKGKMRCLLEKSFGLVEIKKEENGWTGKLCTNPEKPVVQLFGFPADESTVTKNTAPTRLIVRDGELINKDELERLENTDMYCTEIKTEVSIDRLTAKANPRNFERVPAGARFSLNMVIDIYNVDIGNGGESNTEKKDSRADQFVKLVAQGLRLVEDDYLGGQGTRGYGRVKFLINSVKEKTSEDYRKNKAAKESVNYTDKFKDFIHH